MSKTSKTFILILYSILIIVWQSSYYNIVDKNLDKFGRKDASGFSHHFAKHFIYFYYYLGYYPIVTPENCIDYSVTGAEHALIENGPHLLTEYKHFARLGESSRMFLFFPNAWLDGSVKHPSIKLFNAFIFIATLLFIIWLFYKNGYTLLGVILSIILASNPFLRDEVFGKENIFYLLICAAILVLSINLLFIKIKYHYNKKHLFLPIITGVLLAFFSDVRSEINIVVVISVLIYFTVNNLAIFKRLGLICLLIFSFIFTKSLLKDYFKYKLNEANTIVENLGGVPYKGNRIATHTFWHPIFCGLGDFDTKYGYKWKDAVAYAYAKPILKNKFNIDLNWGKYQMTSYWDRAHHYYKKPELIPAYEEVLKTKVLSDIKRDPKWYINIILNRLFVIFNNTSPLYIFGTKIPFYNGWWAILFVIPLIYFKKWLELKLVLLSMPLMATSLIIYSGKNTTFNSVFHLIIAAILINIVAKYIIVYVRKKYVEYYNSLL